MDRDAWMTRDSDDDDDGVFCPHCGDVLDQGVCPICGDDDDDEP